MQANVLDSCPDNRYAARLRGKHINLIGALAHEAPQTFDRICGLNVSMQGSRELVKRQEVVEL